MSTSVSPRGTLRLSRQQSALFPLGSMIKYLSGIATVTEKMELPLDCLTTVQKNNGEKSWRSSLKERRLSHMSWTKHSPENERSAKVMGITSEINQVYSAWYPDISEDEAELTNCQRFRSLRKPEKSPINDVARKSFFCVVILHSLIL